jgi:7-keto-8-aminopelargonate synthetase-like enzyme
MLQKLEQKVLARLKAGKLRSIDVLQPKGAIATSSSNSSDEVEGKKLPLVDFSSNDYLGLARSRSLFHIIEQASRDYTANVAIDQPILGSTGSRLLTGIWCCKHTIDD